MSSSVVTPSISPDATGPTGYVAPVAVDAQPVAAAPFVRPGVSEGGTRQLVPPVNPSTIPGTIQVITPGDAPLVDAALNVLRTSQSGADIVEQLRRVGVRIAIVSDIEMDVLGATPTTQGLVDPDDQVLRLRRSSFQTDLRRFAPTIAHEAVHAIDFVSGLRQGAWFQRRAAVHAEATAQGRSNLETDEMLAQAKWELSIAQESRAVVVGAQVARELGVTSAVGVIDAMHLAEAGANDHATYDKVYMSLVSGDPGGSYNRDSRTIAAPLAL